MELPKATELLKQSWEIFKQKIKILIQIQIIPFIVAIPLLVMMGAAGLLDEKGSKSFSDVNFIAVLAIIALGVLAGVVQLWAQIAMIKAIVDPDSQNIKEMFRQSRHLILPYLWVSVLIGLIVLGGFILLIIPGIIFAFWYCFSPYALILENKRGMEALRTSKGYVKGNIGKIFSRYVLLMLLALVVFAIPSGVLGGLHLKAVGDIYTWVVSLVFSPVAAIYSYLIYRRLQDMKASTGSLTANAQPEQV